CPSPASAPAGRQGRKLGPAIRRASPSPAGCALTHALRPSSAPVLRVRPLGGGDAELPAAAADAGRPARRRAAAALAGADPGEPRDRPDLPDPARRAEGAALAGISALPEAHGGARLRRLDLQLSGKGGRGGGAD